ncbi:MAG TPA: crosslink repair DNA glycosylase YcaQ family protein [Candidatus Limnocylindrales bacterium]
MTHHARHVSARVARRYLVLHQLLAPPRSLPAEPASVMRVVDRLGSLQFDPLEVAGRNHDLVLLARIAGYRRQWTHDLLYRDRVLYETYNKMFSLVPTAELPWYRHAWDQEREAHERGSFDEHAPLVEELLARIRDGGPLSSTDMEPRAAIDWYWRPTNPVRALLEALAEAGILAIARREGNRRIYDLTERLFPAELLDRRPPERDQRLHKLRSRYQANGLLGATGEYTLWYGAARSATERNELRAELEGRGDIVPVVVEGLKGHRFVPATSLPLLDQAEAEVAGEGERVGPWSVGRPGGSSPDVAFLAPLDPLAWDRDLLLRLYGFDYRWEVYVPAAKRRWGYYVLPLLWGDRLVGRIEPRIDRKAKALGVLDLWWEAGFDPLDPAHDGFVDALATALGAHAAFADASRVVLPRTARHRPLVQALRPRLAANVRGLIGSTA